MLFVAPFLSSDHTKVREPNGVHRVSNKVRPVLLVHVLIENLAHEC